MANYININEAAEITGLKPATIRKYARESRIPHYRFGGENQARYRFVEEELQNWIQEHKVEVNNYRNGPRDYIESQVFGRNK